MKASFIAASFFSPLRVAAALAAASAASAAAAAEDAVRLARLASASAWEMTSSPGDGGVVNRPPRSLHLPARNPSSWTYFVVRDLSSLRGLGPPSWGVTSALRVARSRAARIPVLTRVRRMLPDVTRLRRGDARGVDDLVASESRRGVRARARALGLLSRPGVDAIGLERGPTLSASTACDDRLPARLGPPRGSPSAPHFQLRVLSQVCGCQRNSKYP